MSKLSGFRDGWLQEGVAGVVLAGRRVEHIV